MSNLYAQGSGTFSGVTWNTASDGSGSNQTPASGDTCYSNSHDIQVGLATYNGITFNNDSGTYTHVAGTYGTTTQCVISGGQHQLTGTVTFKDVVANCSTFNQSTFPIALRPGAAWDYGGVGTYTVASGSQTTVSSASGAPALVNGGLVE